MNQAVIAKFTMGLVGEVSDHPLDTRSKLSALLSLSLISVVVYRICTIIYRLYFHPLSKFPGPKLYAISNFPFLYHDKILGTFVTSTLGLHQKYGPIVRITPNRIAVDGSIGWPDVFARKGNQPEFEKSPAFYGVPGHVGIIASQKEDHRRQRRLLSHAFSEAALQGQEGYIKTYVDLLMTRLQERAEEGHEFNIIKWYDYVTFDIIGELAFADPFYSLRDSDYHPWVSNIFSTIKSNAQAVFVNQYLLLRPLLFFIVGADDRRKRLDNIKLSQEKTKRRIEMGEANRKDIMTYVLKNNKDGKGMTEQEIYLNSDLIILGGSETTATVLSGLTYYLGQAPNAYEALKEEIRSSFSSENEITMKSVMPLKYLNACLEEALRLFPPAAETPPRVSPGALVDGHYIPKGTVVSVYQWATNRSSNHFTEPEIFAPERWLPESHARYNPVYATDNKSVVRPFAAGPRDCIGKNLAYAEMRLITARMVWNFDMEVSQSQQDWLSSLKIFAFWQKNPLMIKLKTATRTKL